MGAVSLVRGVAAVPATALAAVALATVLAPVAAAAGPVSFGDPSATSKFGDGVDFVQPVTVAAPIARVEVLISTPGSIGPEVQPVDDRPGSGAAALDYHLDLSGGNTVPNTAFTAR